MRSDCGTPRRSRAQWQDLIARAARSPLSVAAFCRGEGVSTASFCNWRKRLAAGTPRALPMVAPAGEPAFFDLGVLGRSGGGEPSPGWEIELELGAGAMLRLRRRRCFSRKRGYGCFCTPARSTRASPSTG
jgi:putative transposase